MMRVWTNLRLSCALVCFGLPLCQVLCSDAEFVAVPMQSDLGSAFGYVDREGNPVIPPRFYRASDFSEGMGLVVIDDEKTGRRVAFIDATGKPVIQDTFADAGSFSEGRAAVRGANGKMGFIDRNGVCVVEYRYAAAYSFNDGLALVRHGEGWGYIDREGEVVAEPRFAGGRSFSEGLAAVCVDVGSRRKWGFIDRRGAIVISPRFDAVNPQHEPSAGFNEGLCAVGVNAPRVSTAGMQEHGSVTQFTSVRWGYIDRSGSFVIAPTFAIAGRFSEELAPVLRELSASSLFEFVGRTGRSIIPPRFGYAEHFANGRALVQANSRYGFIDHSGHLVIPAVYAACSGFRRGISRAEIRQSGVSLEVLIDQTGKVIWAGASSVGGE